MANNHAQVSQDFRILLGGLVPYMVRELGQGGYVQWVR
jgi:hypothetical protein